MLIQTGHEAFHDIYVIRIIKLNVIVRMTFEQTKRENSLHVGVQCYPERRTASNVLPARLGHEVVAVIPGAARGSSPVCCS
jgi:hypothetical protein